MYFVFTRIPGESYCRRLMHVSVVLCLFVFCLVFCFVWNLFFMSQTQNCSFHDRVANVDFNVARPYVGCKSIMSR